MSRVTIGELLEQAGGTLETVDIHRDGVIYVTAEVDSQRYLLYSYLVSDPASEESSDGQPSSGPSS